MKIVAVYAIHLENSYIQYKTKLDFVPRLSRPSVQELLHEFVIAAAESMPMPERKIFEHEQFQFVCHKQHTTVAIKMTDHE